MQCVDVQNRSPNILNVRLHYYGFLDYKRNKANAFKHTIYITFLKFN